MRRSLSFLSLLGILACSQTVGPGLTGFSIQTAEDHYQPGSAVVLRFVNQGETAIHYNDCVGDLQLLQGGSWTTVMPASQVPCRDNLLLLAPQQESTTTIVLSASIQPGKYRFRFQDARDPAGELIPDQERTTNEFTVP